MRGGNYFPDATFVRYLEGLTREDEQMRRMTYVPHKYVLRTAAVLGLGLIVASCGTHHPPPQQVGSTTPSVTYKYHSDDELMQVSQRAETHCRQYNFTARPGQFSTNSDGSRSVIFECVPAATATTTTSPAVQSSNLIYNYRTDQELLNASRSAQAYCMRNGSSQVISTIVSNGDGSKTVTFQCQA